MNMIARHEVSGFISGSREKVLLGLFCSFYEEFSQQQPKVREWRGVFQRPAHPGRSVLDSAGSRWLIPSTRWYRMSPSGPNTNSSFSLGVKTTKDNRHQPLKPTLSIAPINKEGFAHDKTIILTNQWRTSHCNVLFVF